VHLCLCVCLCVCVYVCVCVVFFCRYVLGVSPFILLCVCVCVCAYRCFNQYSSKCHQSIPGPMGIYSLYYVKTWYGYTVISLEVTSKILNPLSLNIYAMSINSSDESSTFLVQYSVKTVCGIVAEKICMKKEQLAETVFFYCIGLYSFLNTKHALSEKKKRQRDLFSKLATIFQ